MRLVNHAIKSIFVIPMVFTLVPTISVIGLAKGTTITFQFPWPAASDPGKVYAKLAEEYHRRNPNITVKIQAGLWHDNLLTQMAGGVSPDLFVITNPNVAPDALAKVAMPLGNYIKASKISPGDFWEPTWRECLYEGEPYALPRESAPNFGLWLNVDAFREVGLPTKAPATIPEFDVFSQKLAKVDPASKAVKRMGSIPWYIYGNSNSLYTWGWCYGGSFYDAKTGKVTLTNNGVAKALGWMKRVCDLYGGTSKINPVIKGDESSSFAAGRIAMQPNGSWAISRIKTEAPKMDYDIVRMPVDDGVSTDPTWIGGHKTIIPRGCKHPQAAWDFLRFICADPVGTEILATYGDMPAYRKSKAYQKFMNDKDMAAYVKILEKAAHIRPEIPVSDLLASEMDEAVTKVLTGKMTPEQALSKAQGVVQGSLDRVMKRYTSRKK